MFAWKNNKFITNLIYSIDNTLITKPTGKYGKAEVSNWDTNKEKLEKLLLAEPQNSEDLTAYILFVDSIGGFKNKKVYKKVSSLLKQAKLMGVSSELAVANKVFAEFKRRAAFFMTLKVLTIILVLAGVVVLNIISLWFLLLSPFLVALPFEFEWGQPGSTNPFS